MSDLKKGGHSELALCIRRMKEGMQETMLQNEYNRTHLTGNAIKVIEISRARNDPAMKTKRKEEHADICNKIAALEKKVLETRSRGAGPASLTPATSFSAIHERQEPVPTSKRPTTSFPATHEPQDPVRTSKRLGDSSLGPPGKRPATASMLPSDEPARRSMVSEGRAESLGVREVATELRFGYHRASTIGSEVSQGRLTSSGHAQDAAEESLRSSSIQSVLRGSSRYTSEGATAPLELIQISTGPWPTMRPYALKLCVPEGNQTTAKEGDEIPDDLRAYIWSEFLKLVQWTDAKTTAWNKLMPNEEACVLLQVIAKKGSSSFTEALRACDTCSVSTSSRKAKPRPCALLREDESADGGVSLLVLPLREELRQGLTWEQECYWVREQERRR